MRNFPSLAVVAWPFPRTLLEPSVWGQVEGAFICVTRIAVLAVCAADIQNTMLSHGYPLMAACLVLSQQSLALSVADGLGRLAVGLLMAAFPTTVPHHLTKHISRDGRLWRHTKDTLP
jgi:hypothetical protein